MRMQSITTAFLLAEITPDKPDMQVCAAPMTATGKGFVEMYLAAGLPLTSFGRDKKAFQDYLCRGGKRCPSAMKDKTMPSREEAKKAGCNGFITKPILPEYFLTEIKKYFS